MTSNHASAMLTPMFQYQSWANAEFVAALREPNTEQHATQHHLGIRLLNHCLVVNRIFAAHLVGAAHGYSADNTVETPTIDQLGADLAQIDRWYLDYVATVTPAMLAESVPLTFTDGDLGAMTRQEMLIHVVTHGGYHRGEVGRLMKQAAADSAQEVNMPWDTFAVFLHRSEPQRRQR